MSRVLTTEISGIECLSVSLIKINNNFNNIDTTLCTVSSNFTQVSLVTSTGTVGKNVLGIPGIITAYAGVHIPSYWAFCDGSELDKASFPALSSVIGNTYGVPSNSNNFKLPDLQNTILGSVLVGPGAAGTAAYNQWYNVDDYYSVEASSDGAPGALGTITLTFSTTTGQTSAYTYTAVGGGDDTYLEWNQNNVIASAGYPILKTPKAIYNRPFQQNFNTVFRFTRSGTPVNWYINSTLRKTVQNYNYTTTQGTTANPGTQGNVTVGQPSTALLTITSSLSSMFGAQAVYPSGSYRVQYVTGGYCLGNTANWEQRVGYKCNLVHSNNSQDVEIGVYDTTLSQSYDSLITSGQHFNGTGIPWYYDFYHTGGPIYIYLKDSTYSNNTLGNAAGYNPSAPTYSLYYSIPTVALNHIISTNA